MGYPEGDDQPDTRGATAVPPSASNRGAATACLWLGVLGLFTWVVPMLGMVAPAVGLALGWQGRRSSNRDRARLGIVLCTIALGLGVLMLYWFIQLLDTAMWFADDMIND